MHQFIVIRRPDDPEDVDCHAYKRLFPDLGHLPQFFSATDFIFISLIFFPSKLHILYALGLTLTV